MDKIADEAIDEITETLLKRVKNGKAKEIQALEKAAKDIAIAKAVLSRINTSENQLSERGKMKQNVGFRTKQAQKKLPPLQQKCRGSSTLENIKTTNQKIHYH